jgi:hypothetical protein
MFGTAFRRHLVVPYKPFLQGNDNWISPFGDNEPVGLSYGTNTVNGSIGH